MTETGQVTVSDTVRWLHEEGLPRLVGVAARMSNPVVAYTVDVATGTVTAHPTTSVGAGSDVFTLAADDLPHPQGSARRLVIIGVTVSDAVLVVDLATSLGISINADQPAEAARAWVMQLLLNPEITLTTNSAAVAVTGAARYRRTYIPGADAMIINVDDRRPPVTTVTLNAIDEGPDHLDVAADGAGEMYLGSRFWRLREVLRIGDNSWTTLASTLTTASGN
ncbi:hypothetical protein [Nocardia sp. NPDC050793]|uniref:hypothetical protein n=1 Tax=Nocardia sp. NPDC050793 TaxID=3155159 RepID=UPI0033FB2A04